MWYFIACYSALVYRYLYYVIAERCFATSFSKHFKPTLLNKNNSNLVILLSLSLIYCTFGLTRVFLVLFNPNNSLSLRLFFE